MQVISETGSKQKLLMPLAKLYTGSEQHFKVPGGMHKDRPPQDGGSMFAEHSLGQRAYPDVIV